MTGLIDAERMPVIHEAIWTPAQGGEVRIPFSLSSAQPEAILFTGFAETDVSRIARDLGSMGLNLAVTNLRIPSQGRRTDPVEYRSAIAGSVSAVRYAVLNAAQYASDTRLGAVGISKGGGEVIVGVGANPDEWEWVLLASPLGGTLQEPEDIKGRLLVNGIDRELPSGLSFGGLGREYGAGMVLLASSNGPKEITDLSKRKQLVVVVAGNDKVILADQTKEALSSVKVVCIDGMEHFSCYETEIKNIPVMYNMGKVALRTENDT